MALSVPRRTDLEVDYETAFSVSARRGRRTNAKHGDKTLRKMDRSHDGAWLRKVYELGKAFAARPELDELIPFVLTRCREVLNADGVAVYFLTPSARNSTSRMFQRMTRRLREGCAG